MPRPMLITELFSCSKVETQRVLGNRCGILKLPVQASCWRHDMDSFDLGTETWRRPSTAYHDGTNWGSKRSNRRRRRWGVYKL